MDDQQLKKAVRAAGRGDEGAARRLFDHSYPKIYRYALAKLGDPANAEDVAAETFARALRDLDRYRWKGAGFDAWLFRIARNLVVDHARRAARERPQPLEPEESPGVAEWTPEEIFVRGETSSELRGLLERLAPDQREVLVLRFSSQLSTHEVAQVMGRKVNAVRQLQFRALENMRRLLDEEAMRA